ncbi:MAG: flagellar export chaperone FliS [Deltaproteobacteria bacterium]|nr:flagellar export chaperone FliS [Deltaproteobacteria bacterium]MBW2050797.1 flagellar export chaperone FliS [Deltaproteobacteria bacterium]MBW2140911.1 flagellar export chaperone FliS [Deltaproteobacteria bacterium]MBW2322664.1 flagellar export chaperone FliS [Deltaproteobacteria bacterium]
MSGYGQMQYKRTQVTTVDKGRLIVLLYEGAIKFIRQAKECSQAKDFEGKANNINRAMDIIAELNHSLNMKEGGEISANLRKLYLFISDQLLKSKINNDIKSMDDVVQILNTLLEAWNEVVNKPEAKQVLPQGDSTSMRASVKV